MFSERTNWNPGLNSLTLLLRDLQQRGETVIDLTLANPTSCGLPPLPKIDLPDPSQLKYEPDPKGLPAARTAVAQFYNTQGVSVDPGSILLTSGTSEAYSWLLSLLCNPGEHFAVPSPGYPLLDDLACVAGVGLHRYRMRYDGEWHIPAGEVERSCHQATKGILLIHPNNPTGSYIRKNEWDAIQEIARQRAIAVVADEVFSGFEIDKPTGTAVTFAGTPDILTFTLNGLSKMAGLPHVKLGWIVVSGPDALRREAMRRLEILSDSYLAVSTPVQHVLPEILRRHEIFAAPIRDRIRKNHGFLKTAVPESGPVSLLRAEGGWNAVLRMPNVRSSEEWALEALRRHRVLVHPGDLFGWEGEGILVVSLLPEPEVFREGIGRLLSMD